MLVLVDSPRGVDSPCPALPRRFEAVRCSQVLRRSFRCLRRLFLTSCCKRRGGGTASITRGGEAAPQWHDMTRGGTAAKARVKSTVLQRRDETKLHGTPQQSGVSPPRNAATRRRLASKSSLASSKGTRWKQQNCPPHLPPSTCGRDNGMQRANSTRCLLTVLQTFVGRLACAPVF